MVWRGIAMPDGLTKSYPRVSSALLRLRLRAQRLLLLPLTFRVATVAVALEVAVAGAVAFDVNPR